MPESADHNSADFDKEPVGMLSGTTLRAWRESRNWRPERAASWLEVSSRTYGLYEKAERVPRAVELAVRFKVVSDDYEAALRRIAEGAEGPREVARAVLARCERQLAALEDREP